MSLLIKGITKLSQLAIDTAKDWAGLKIENLGAPNSGDDAKRHDSAPAAHESTHVSGGSDDIDSALSLAAIPATLTGKDADSVDGKEPGTTSGKLAYLDANARVQDSAKLEGSSKATVQNHTPKAHTLNSHSAANGAVDFNEQEATDMRIDNRTSDPGSPAEGQTWIRTD